MPDPNDIALLKQYIDENSQAAFAELVTRYVNLVYSAAIRKVGNEHAAQEISQAVFIVFARKAKSLGAKTILSGWFYQTTRLTAANYLRTEIRRQKREHEAYMQTILNEPQSEEAWLQVAPLLEDAMGRLDDCDRNAIVLRFFENKSLHEVGAAIGSSEDAAKVRVSRALKKLQKFFSKHGVTSSTATLAGAISANSIQAAPAILAKTATAVALAKGATASTSTLTIVKGALKIMAWTKAQTAIVTTTVLLLAAGTTTTVVVKEIHSSVSHSTSWTDDPKYWQLDFNNQNATFKRISNLPPVSVLRPTRFPTGYGFMSTGGKMIGKNQTASQLIRTAYDPSYSHRFIMPEGFSSKNYDIMMTLPDKDLPYEKLKQELARQLGVTAHFETNEVDVFFLKQINTNTPGLVHANGGTPSVSLSLKNGKMVVNNWPLNTFASQFDYILKTPVIDETGIVGNYNCTLKWSQRPGESTNDAFKRAVSEQLGLEFMPGRKSIPMLIVERAP